MDIATITRAVLVRQDRTFEQIATGGRYEQNEEMFNSLDKFKDMLYDLVDVGHLESGGAVQCGHTCGHQLCGCVARPCLLLGL